MFSTMGYDLVIPLVKLWILDLGECRFLHRDHMIKMNKNPAENVIFEEISVIDHELCVVEYGLWEDGFSCSPVLD